MSRDKRVSELLAHSPRAPGVPGDPYSRHVAATRDGAAERAEAMLRYARTSQPEYLASIIAAALFHDLGKLDPDNQAALRTGRAARLVWDHIDAGVAHLSNAQDWMAAWLVRAHHAPGLPAHEEHFNVDDLGRRLRGRRRPDGAAQPHDAQINRTDTLLSQYLADHESVLGGHTLQPAPPRHGLAMRLALSCLVDADHSDTAVADGGLLPPKEVEPRWQERLAALCAYVRSLPEGQTDAEKARNQRRSNFFEACLNATVDSAMVACEGPVGLGKTTAVTAFLLQQAIRHQLRRIVIVAPYTNILSQTADRLRKALQLPGERAADVIVEHHHRADFENLEDRELAALWRAPIVLTTAVSFFETLSACRPGPLRKLHALPGSAIFLDEAHAALPTRLWPQNWRWLRQLATDWGCRIVLASGSLSRFWEQPEIVRKPVELPELLPSKQAVDVLASERHRIRYAFARDGSVLDVATLISLVRAAPGPRLVILNTVQNAAIVAKRMREDGMQVLHLSTALAPRDRERIIRCVERSLKMNPFTDWTLVATSCVEAGVDFSFRCAFRERFSVSSTIQVGGRVNRHGEYDAEGGGVVYDFALDDAGVTRHPDAEQSSKILLEMMREDRLNSDNPATIVTDAMRRELFLRGGLGEDPLMAAECAHNYPEVAAHGRVITADTRLVVVSHKLKRRLRDGEHVDFRTLLRGSVQLWSAKIAELGLEPLSTHSRQREIYLWNDAYDAQFLGYMEGVLRMKEFLSGEGGII